MAELKPCSFCGGEAVIEGVDYHWVSCASCGVETMGNENVEIVIEAWNGRAENA